MLSFVSITDRSWAIILRAVGELKKLESPQKSRPAAFSFFRSVSKEVYERQCSQYVKCPLSRGRFLTKALFLCSPNLMDGCTPILVMDTNDVVDSLRKASIKHSMDSNNNCSPRKA